MAMFSPSVSVSGCRCKIGREQSRHGKGSRVRGLNLKPVE